MCCEICSREEEEYKKRPRWVRYACRPNGSMPYDEEYLEMRRKYFEENVEENQEENQETNK